MPVSRRILGAILGSLALIGIGVGPALADTPPATSWSYCLHASNGDTVCQVTMVGHWLYGGNGNQVAQMTVGDIVNNTGRCLTIVTDRLYDGTGALIYHLVGGEVQPGVTAHIGGDVTFDPTRVKWSLSTADCNRPGLGGSGAVLSGNGL